MIKTIQKLREENSVEDVKIILEGEGGNVMGEGTVIKIDISKFKKEEDRETDLISTLERLKETVERFRDTMDSYNKENFKHITDRKSTRLNSSHVAISYAVFCLKRKQKIAA